MIVLLVALAVVFVGCVATDLYLGRHPLKRADVRTDKYKYKGF